MSFRKNKPVYLANIHQFLSWEIDVTTFDSVHCKLWRQDRDEDHELTKNAPQKEEIHTLRLLFRAGELTQEECRNQACAKHREMCDRYLRYSPDDWDFCHLVDKIFVALDAYDLGLQVTENPPYYLNESQLREAIMRYLRGYETLLAFRAWRGGRQFQHCQLEKYQSSERIATSEVPIVEVEDHMKILLMDEGFQIEWECVGDELSLRAWKASLASSDGGTNRTFYE